jgi:N-acetylglucosaminyldiphosphoundecaprenol N-acetyl-beta-D-mannosaminyltransferase
MPDVRRFRLGGVGISCVDMRSALDSLYADAAAKTGGYYAFTCAHGIVDSQADPRLRMILNGSRITMPDGMPLVWFGRLKGRQLGRVTAPDFLETAMRDPRSRTLRHYFYGASPEAIERIATRAAGLLGADAIAGYYSPPMRPAGAPEDPEVLERIAAARPDLIWVGLGLPKQEYWMATHRHVFKSSLLLGVGAAFDWFAGTQPRAPQWIQAVGMEWAHRVASEPARLWPRYRRVVPEALAIFAKEILSPEEAQDALNS